ncbi:outer membrane beta-barrel protein [Parabacteroides chinchillae]
MDKERDILHIYRERQDEFHLPLRDGGWNRLEKELVPQPVVVRRLNYRRWAVAAAILVCVLLSIPMFLPKEAAVLVSDSQPVKVVEQKNDPVMEKPSALPQHSNDPVRKHLIRQITSVSVVSESPAIAEAELVLSKPELEKESEAVSKEVPVKTQKSKRSDAGPEPEHKKVLSKEVVDQNKKNRKKKSEGWSFGVGGGSGKTVSGMNMFSNDDMCNSPGDMQPPFENPDDPDNPDEKPDNPEIEPSATLLSTRAEQRLPQMRNASYEYVHRMPLSVGFSVKKNITGHFGLESGLTYTFLYSDIKQSGTKGYIGDQRIHYLGIPLKANGTVYRKGIFSMYLSGGLLTEYCVSAKRRIIHEITKPEMNRWQFSVNAAIGAEVKLIHPLSLYLEPGVGYYFDTGDDMPTIRNERPWMFGLQLGLRLSY